MSYNALDNFSHILHKKKVDRAYIFLDNPLIVDTIVLLLLGSSKTERLLGTTGCPLSQKGVVKVSNHLPYSAKATVMGQAQSEI